MPRNFGQRPRARAVDAETDMRRADRTVTVVIGGYVLALVLWGVFVL